MRPLNTITHRGIALIQSDHPSGAITWSDDVTGLGDVAHTVQEAIRQISEHIGPDPDCPRCHGGGCAVIRAAGPFVPCPVCFPVDP